MKLKDETKLRLSLKQINHWLILLLLLFLIVSQNTFGQSSPISFSNTSLSDALKQVSKSLGISISFDSKVMSEKQVSGTYTLQNPDELLQQLLVKTGYHVVKKYGNYLVVPGEILPDSVADEWITVTGVLADRATGEHLPYATIFLPDRNSYLSSSVSGTFLLKAQLNRPVTMSIQYLGYQKVDTTLLFSNQGEVFLFRMKPKSMELSPITVKKDRLKMIEQNKETSHSTINPVGYVNLPNIGETDVFRALQLLPGVGYSEGSSALSIRGGTADQNMVLFDGFTLYNLDHFFGTFSSVNPNVIKDIQIYKGGFDSRYGERLSGIVDITGKTGNRYRPKINAGLNLVSGNLEVELPIAPKWTFIVAGRRSYADIYTSYLVKDLVENHVDTYSGTQTTNSTMQLQPGYYFYDYNSKLTFSKSETEKISVSVFGGKDFLSSAGEGRNKLLYSQTTDNNNWGNYGLSLSWLKQWHRRFFTNLQIGYSGYDNSYDNTTVVNSKVKSKIVTVGTFNSEETNELHDFSASLRNQFSLSSRNSIDFGFQSKYNEYAYLKSEGVDAYYSDIANSSWLYSAYGQFKTQQLKNLTIKAGSRVNYYNLSGKFYYEPRLSGSYDIAKVFQLKFAAGRYYQFLSKVAPTQSYGYNRDFWVISDGKNHPVMYSDQIITGLALNFKHFSFDVEAYQKNLNGLQLFLYIPSFQNNADINSFKNQVRLRKILPSKFINGTGQSVGVDFLAKYESSNFTSWISYSVGQSIRNFKDINASADIPAPFDKLHEVKWTNLFTWKRWNLSSLWVYSTGQPYVSNQSVDRTLTARFTYDRLPDYNRLDVAANYTIPIRKVSVKIGASLINCLNKNNFNDIYSRDFNFDTTVFNETTYVRSMGITPNFFLNIQY